MSQLNRERQDPGGRIWSFGRALLLSALAIASLPVLFAGTTVLQVIPIPGVERIVAEDGMGNLNLYLETEDGMPVDPDTPWEQDYAQDDPNYQNGCGPVAGRNLLSWYGVDNTVRNMWTMLAKEMKTNHSAESIDAYAGCTALCGPEPACFSLCTHVIQSSGNMGTRQSAFVNAMQTHAPPGYKMYFHAHRHSLEDILEPLRDGNPPVAIITTGNKVNHFVVITGTYRDADGRTMLRLGNNEELSWADFERKWSRIDFGDDLERSVMDEVIGEKPYFLAFYARSSGQKLGRFCTAHGECASGLCDTREGAGCVPKGDGQHGDVCTDHLQCESRRCVLAAGKAVGACSQSSLPLDASCSTHEACASGLCDPRPLAGCVPDGDGEQGEICTDHNQCLSKKCMLVEQYRGKCSAAGKALGESCSTHPSCASGLCDPRPLAGCVPNRNGKRGEICTDHAQCLSQRCELVEQYRGKCQ